MSPAAEVQAATLGQRTLAWIVDFAVLSPLLYWLAWPPLARSFAATATWMGQVQSWLLERMLAADTLPPVASLAQVLLDDPVQGAAARAQVAQLSTAILQAGLLAASASALYFVAFESSRWQATPGKRLLGLRVDTLAGSRLSLARALGRHLAGAASWLTLNIGHLLVALRPDRRALHDLIAGTRVRAASALPGWGRALLGALLALAVLLPVWLALQLLGRIAA